METVTISYKPGRWGSMRDISAMNSRLSGQYGAVKVSESRTGGGQNVGRTPRFSSLAHDAISVRVPHILVSRVISADRRDSVPARLGADDALVSVVVP